MIPELELVKSLIQTQAREYAAIVRGLDYLIANAPVIWPIRLFMHYERWMHGRLLAALLEQMPDEERAAALGQGAE